MKLINFKKISKKLIIIFSLLWLVTKPFRYLKYTNITIAIANIMLGINYCLDNLYRRKKNMIYKILRNFSRLIILGSGLIFIVTQVLIYITPYRETKRFNEEKFDYIIVLGAGLRGKDLSKTLKFRLDKFLQLNLDYNPIVVLSGGQGPDELITEAKAMRDYLIENGVDESRLILEEKSTSTFENFKFSLEKIKSADLKVDENTNFAVISNDFHIFRSTYILKRLGYKSVGIAAKTPGVVKLDYFFREFFALINTIFFDFR